MFTFLLGILFACAQTVDSVMVLRYRRPNNTESESEVKLKER